MRDRPCHCNNFTPGHPLAKGHCAPCWHFHHTASIRKSWGGDGNVIPITGPPPAEKYVVDRPHRQPTSALPTTCPSLGERLEFRAGCSSGLGCRHKCNSEREDVARHLGETMITVPNEDCADCPGRPGATVSLPLARAVPVGMGVVIGCYNWPRLAELQIRTIRDKCGAVPILLADDGSPKHREFTRLASLYSDVTVASSPARAGHYAGDRDAFRKGVEWGRDRGLFGVVKLSQRMIFTRPDWLSEAMGLLRKSPILCTRMTEGPDKSIYQRTEAVGMRVEDWLPLLPRLSGGALSNATELLINDFAVNTFHNQQIGWPWLPANRYLRSGSTLWHCTHTLEEYRECAAGYGLGLDDDFHTAGLDKRPGWKRG